MGSAEFILVSGLLVAAFAVYTFVSALMSNSQTEKDLLSWASGQEPVQSKSGLINMSRPMVHQFTLKYALKYKNVGYRKRVNKIILTVVCRVSLMSTNLLVCNYYGEWLCQLCLVFLILLLKWDIRQLCFL